MTFIERIVFILLLSSLIFSCKKKNEPPVPLEKNHRISFAYYTSSYGDTSNLRAPLNLTFYGNNDGASVNSFSCRFLINDSLIYDGEILNGRTVKFLKGGTYKFTFTGYYDGEIKEIIKYVTILPPYKSVDITKVTYRKLYLMGIYEYLNPYIIFFNSDGDTIYNGINEYMPQTKEENMPITYNFNYNINLEGNTNNIIKLSLEDKKPSPWEQSTTISDEYIFPYTFGCDYLKNPYPEVVNLTSLSWGVANDSVAVYFKWNE